MNENARTQPMFPPEEISKAAHFNKPDFIGLWVANEQHRQKEIKRIQANIGTQSVTQKQW